MVKGSNPGFLFNNYPIDDISVEKVTTEIFKMISAKDKGFIVTPNAAHFLYLRKDEAFREAYRRASFVLPDGSSLIFASRLLGRPLTERCTGVDVFYSIIEKLRNGKYKIFLLGGMNGSEQVARDRLLSNNPELKIETYNPPDGFESDTSETEKIIHSINSLEPDLLFVFAGSPKSEKFISRNFNDLRVTVALSLGATLDYYSGMKKRAPEWVRKTGFEWLYRFLKEPRRLFRRYLTGNSYFIYLTLKQLILPRKPGLNG